MSGGTGWNVLVVDDSEQTLVLTQDFLKSQGCVVATATSAEKAVEQLETFEPDVILLDLAMPYVNGFELQQMLRERAALDHVPILAVTARVSYEDKLEVEQAGFDGFVSKPYRIGEFLNEIKASLERRQKGESWQAAE